MKSQLTSTQTLRAVVALAALALAGACAGPASAAPAWQKSTLSISTPAARSGEVAVAIDDVGGAVAVWAVDLPDGEAIQSASREPEGVWSAPVELTLVSGTSSFSSSRPKVAITAAGEAVAVWVAGDSNHGVVESASRPRGGVWSTPVTLSGGSALSNHPEIAINDSGEAVVVWHAEQVHGRGYVGRGFVASASRSSSGAWSAPEAIDMERAFTAPRPMVSINSAGEAVAVWERESRSGAATALRSAARPPDGVWSAPVTLSRRRGDHVSRSPEIAIDDAGEAVAVWEGCTDVRLGFVPDSNFVRSASRSPDGRWSPPRRVSASPDGNLQGRPFPHLAVNATGDAVVVWQDFGDHGPTIMGASRLAQRDWARPKRISRRSWGVVMGPDVGIDAAGEARVVWGREKGRNGGFADGLVGASSPLGGGWSATTGIADIPGGERGLLEAYGPHGFPEVAVNSSGEAVAVWERQVPGTSLVVIDAAVLS
ncbi:MAG TPA: hypothetical protein VHI77_06500 [Solirubrobacterales bacterium]|jgi:hypothetical protein|nr:hypothetical protein [Solirubrobacterales bacterium]